MAMEEQRRPPSSKIAPVSMKASSANATLQGMKNRSHFRRDRKTALQQDVCGQAEEEVVAREERPLSSKAGVLEAALPRLPIVSSQCPSLLFDQFHKQEAT
ncbi:hypothetical protein ZEAMMB73_Zm00001d016679 [Zea mays]|uniref:Uncharacterized protein n=1 Tax=Zea mays TaxID=4577 RepID=A0A1D6H9N9_MAIZE|nr:hypothetical protein ZEAMMB73_Zm00001d016679 [Zea mays]